MSAYRTHIRCLGTYHDMTAVAALPNLDLTLLEYFLHFYILEKCAVSFLMMLLDLTHHAELGSKLGKSFLFCCLCKSLLHVSPLVILPLCCSKKVLGCSSYPV